MAVDLVAVSRHLEQTLGVPPLIRLQRQGAARRRVDDRARARTRTAWRRRLAATASNVGMLTGDGLVVVDVDLYHPDGEGSFERLRDLGLPIETVTAITGGGGRHYLYRTDGADPVRRRWPASPASTSRATAARSSSPRRSHPDTGRPYEWEHTWAPGDVEPLELPGRRSSRCSPRRRRATSRASSTSGTRRR